MEQITTSDDLIDFLTLPGYRFWRNSPHNNMEHLHMKTRTQQIEELQRVDPTALGRHSPPVQRRGSGEVTWLG